MDTTVDKLNNSNDQYNFIDKLDIEKLEELYLYTNEKYRNDNSVISDALYDMIEDFIRMKNPKSKLLKEIGAKVKTKNKVKLPYNLGSMDKIKPSTNKLDNWKKKFTKSGYYTYYIAIFGV